MNEQQLSRLVAIYQQRLANSEMESAQLSIRLEDVEQENARLRQQIDAPAPEAPAEDPTN